jgi:hypothetical protein
MWIVVNLLTDEILGEVYRHDTVHTIPTTVLAFNTSKQVTHGVYKFTIEPKKFLLLCDARKALFEHIKPEPSELLHYEFVLLGKDGQPVSSVFPRNQDEASYNKRHP